MSKDRRTLVTWIKNHKKGLIITGVSITAFVLALIASKNYKAIVELFYCERKRISPNPMISPTIHPTLVNECSVNSVLAVRTVDKSDILLRKAPHNVSEHIRNLPNGHKASADKLALAAAKGLCLLQGQTIVNAYTTGNTAA